VLLAGVGGVTWAISVSAYQQSTIPPSLLGRSVAAYRWLGWTGFFLGSVLGGATATLFGLQLAFALFTLPAIIALVAYGLRNPLVKSEAVGV
jgi:MFS family permease